MSHQHTPSDDNFLRQGEALLESLGGESIIDEVTQRSAQAANRIISAIDPKTETALHELQAIPVVLVAREEPLAALFFLEHSIGHGGIFGWEIVHLVLEDASRYMVSLEQGLDREALEVIRVFFGKLLRVLGSSEYYAQYQELYLFVAEYQKMMHPGKSGNYDAIDTYNTALVLNSSDIYQRLAETYESLGQYGMSAQVLSM